MECEGEKIPCAKAQKLELSRNCRWVSALRMQYSRVRLGKALYAMFKFCTVGVGLTLKNCEQTSHIRFLCLEDDW